MPAIPRLELEGFEPKLAAMLGPRIERLGYLGEFFKCAAHQPAALRSFLTFTEDLKVALPSELTELGALTVAGKLANAYERNQHERLCVNLGFSKDWIAAVNRLDPDHAAELSGAQRVAQRLALAVLDRGGRDCAAERDAMTETWNAPITIGFLMLIGRYATHAMIVNTLELAPPVASIFEGARA